jgi:PAS domain S-box-containing protein
VVDQSSGDGSTPDNSKASRADERDAADGEAQRFHDVPRELGRHATSQPPRSARACLDAAAVRDEAARLRDLHALARDQAAAVRDLLMAALDQGAEVDDARAASSDDTARAAEQRRRAAEHRACSAEQRALAALDREASAAERVLAAHDRRAARADREEIAGGSVESGAGVLESWVDDLRSMIDRSPQAFVVMDAGGFVTDWNTQAERTFGWSREEAVGRVLGDLIIPARYRAAHLQGLRRHLDTGEAPVLDKRIEISALDRAGCEFPVELTISRYGPSSSPPRFTAFLHDISERQLSARSLAAQRAIASVFSQARDTREAMSALLARLGLAMSWQAAAWWSPGEDGHALRCVAVWRREGAPAPWFTPASMELMLARGAGLPGRVWDTAQPTWTADLAADPRFQGSQAATRAGLHGALCVPVATDQRFHGAMEFFGADSTRPDERTVELVAAIATQIGGLVSLLDEREALTSRLEHGTRAGGARDLDNRDA